jgi:hypothetical protein
MGAWHYLNTDQSGMWVDPEEHIQNLRHSNDQKYMGMPMEHMWMVKEAESMEPEGTRHGAGIYDSLMRGSDIHEPIALLHHDDLTTSPTQIDGHHRVAAAAAAQRALGRQIRVPVEYLHPRYGADSAKENMTRKRREGQGMAASIPMDSYPGIDWNSPERPMRSEPYEWTSGEY